MNEKDNRNFIIQFGDKTYYSKNVRWKGVKNIKKATWLTQFDAYRLKNHLNKTSIDMKAQVLDK